MTTVEHAHSAPPVRDLEPEADEPRRRRRRLVWPAVGAALIAVGAGAWLWAANASTDSPPTPAGTVATATVERATISAIQSWDGTLDHGTPFTINNGADGTITRLVDQGQTIAPGDELYRINERPVTLLAGPVPMYANLGPGDTGADVAQLESNLTALGYTGFTADDEYTESTAAAVRAWQANIGAEQTGTVARGDVAFVPAAGRVDALHVHVGDVLTPGAPVLDITGTEEVVSLDVDIDDRDRLGVGTAVTVVLPGGNEVAGTVSASTVVQVAATPEGGSGGDQAEAESISAVEITLAEDVDDSLVGAPVEVIVALDERTDVLVVPVSALLALAEGGYGLEAVRDDETTEIVTVDTGLFADGRVEISGDRIAEGTVVGVAGR